MLTGVFQGCPILLVECLSPAEFSSHPNEIPAEANQALTRHTRNFQAGVLRQVGAKLCSGLPGLSLDTSGLF